MNRPMWVILLTVVIVFAYFLLTTAVLIWAERRVVARMQSRLGPNRVGPFGALQTLVDGAKMFFKEDITPAMVKQPIFTIAPLVGVVAGFLSVAIIPISGDVTLGGETFVLQVADLGVGVLWFLAMGSIHVYSVFLAGWASSSPYPLLGGVRASAQMISYEIAQGLAVASVFIYAGSLRVSDIIAAQSGPGFVDGVPGWFAIPLFPAFVVFVIGMVAEAGRPPFDMAEAEGELVGGFHTEYSGLRFGMFMLAEFMSVIIMSADRRHALPRRPRRPDVRPARAVPVDPADRLVLAQDGRVRVLLHPAPRRAAAHPLRPPDGARLEGADPRRARLGPHHRRARAHRAGRRPVDQRAPRSRRRRGAHRAPRPRDVARRRARRGAGVGCRGPVAHGDALPGPKSSDAADRASRRRRG
jgi:NADH:ubiquinone oxidoreductase subunit H